MAQLNGVMMQYFHWYMPEDGRLWQQVKDKSTELAEAGITALWLPPAYKGSAGGYDNGYGVYDLFDLGEFDQKGSVRTKYGTKDEFLAAVKASKEVGIDIYADAVFNHKMGGDEAEEFEAIALNPDNRMEYLGDYHTIKAWTRFTFPGRQGKYSEMIWNWTHFTAIDYNAYAGDDDGYKIYLFKGAELGEEVSPEKGNYDYLMGCDLNMEHPEVLGELNHWGKWFVELTGVKGFRFDAVKHVNADMFESWLEHLTEETGQDLYAVGEYWSYNLDALKAFLHQTKGRMSLFDAPLQHNFHLASKLGDRYDMRKIFDGTLVQVAPTLAVTLVENHDTQPLQALEAPVEAWFKPLAYAIILLRAEGYPCIFYPDYYGADYKDVGKDGNEYDIHLASHRFLIDIFLKAREAHAYGEQYDYFNHGNCVGWTRLGDDAHPGGMAVIMSTGGAGFKWMEIAQKNKTYVDATGHIKEAVTSNDHGWAEFKCKPGSVSVWVPQESV